MDQKRVHVRTESGVPILVLKGYIQRDEGVLLKKVGETILEGGNPFFAVDLSECLILASPGVVALVEVVLAATDMFGGKVVLCGLDPMKEDVLRMVGIFNYVLKAGSSEEAVKVILGLRGKAS